MAIQVQLLGWKSNGLRSPDHEIQLVRSGESLVPITLIQMPNGTGKTTSLELLRASLSGAATHWTAEQVRSLARPKATLEKGSFLVQLRVNGTLLTFELILDYAAGRARYRTTYGKGVTEGHKPPPGVARFFKPELVNLFIFDGELASQLLDSKKTRARDAVDTVFQVSLLDHLSGEFEQNWQEHAQQQAVKGEKGRTRRRNRMEKLQARYDALMKIKAHLAAECQTLRGDLGRVQDEYDQALKQGKDIGEKLDDVSRRWAIADAQVQETTRAVIAAMRDPQALSAQFAADLNRLKTNLDRLKLPRSTSRQFFVELAEMPDCVCGRPIDEAISKAIIENADRFLDNEEVGVLNNVKSDIALYCGDAPDAPQQALDALLKKISNEIRERDLLSTERKNLEEESLQQGGEELQALKSKVDDLKSKLAKCEAALAEIEQDPDGDEEDDTTCLKALKKRLEAAQNDYARATETLQLKKKTEVIRSILQRASEEARHQLGRMLVDETNGRIQKLLKMSPLSMEDVRDHLVLSNQDGASTGQKLAVGYAFLTTLFERGTHELPFVVDSPAGPLDNTVRTEVAQLIPGLAGQFVAFTISSERGHFIEPLDRAANHKIQYVTVYRKAAATPGIDEARKATTDRVVENNDSIVVYGRSFFDRFDILEEQ